MKPTSHFSPLMKKKKRKGFHFIFFRGETSTSRLRVELSKPKKLSVPNQMQRELHVDAGLDRCLSWLSTPSVLGCFLSSYRDSSPAYCLKPRVLGPSLAYCLELGASINEFHLLFIFIFFILKKWYENAFQQLRNLRILEKYKIAICANNRPVI